MAQLDTSRADKGDGVLVVSSCFVAFSFIAVLCRFLTRYLIVRSAGPDDICIAVGWVRSSDAI